MSPSDFDYGLRCFLHLLVIIFVVPACVWVATFISFFIASALYERFFGD